MSIASNNPFFCYLKRKVPYLLMFMGVGACVPSTNVPPATQEQSAPTSAFPSKDELASIPDATVPQSAKESNAVRVSNWKSTTMTASQTNELSYPETPLTTYFLKIAGQTKHKVHLSAGLHCSALELGTFTLNFGGRPTQKLERLIHGRCGNTVSSISSFRMAGTINADMSEAELVQRWQSELQKFFTSVLKDSHDNIVAVRLVRKEKKAEIIVLSAYQQMVINPVLLVTDNVTSLQITGKVLSKSAGHVTGLVNKGKTQFAECGVDPMVHFPNFKLNCPVFNNDTHHWIQLGWRPKNRMLMTSGAMILMHQSNWEPTLSDAAGEGQAQFSGDIQTQRAEIIKEINDIRKEASLPALVLEAKESVTHQRLLGPLMKARTESDFRTADKISLGLMAGWDVPSVIRNGSFLLSASFRNRNFKEWLDDTMDIPIGRATIMSPESTAIAIGVTTEANSQFVATALTTYALFDTETFDKQMRNKLIDKLQASRQAAGMVPAEILPEPPSVANITSRLRTDQVSTSSAINEYLNAVSQQHNKSVTGHVIEFTGKESIDWPANYVTAQTLSLSVSVGHHRLPGSPWGVSVLMTAITE
jgi:hypothetical protein